MCLQSGQNDLDQQSVPMQISLGGGVASMKTRGPGKITKHFFGQFIFPKHFEKKLACIIHFFRAS